MSDNSKTGAPFSNPALATEHEHAIVYVREADRTALPKHLQGAPGKLFALHSQDGECLALTQDRKVAFALARQNDLTPVSVH